MSPSYTPFAIILTVDYVLQALCRSLSRRLGTPEEETELEYSSAVVLSLQTEASVRTVIEVLLKLTQSQVRLSLLMSMSM